MVNNTTIWTQTNLAQWAENSNRGSWYKYLQSSRSLQNTVKGRMSSFSNLGSSVKVIYTPIKNWVESDSAQWTHIDRHQWLSWFSDSKSLLVSIIAVFFNDTIDLQSAIKPLRSGILNLSATVYGGFNAILNLLAIIQPLDIEIISWTDIYKSQWWSDNTVQWVDFLWYSKVLYGTIKGWGNQNVNLQSALKGGIQGFKNLVGYIIGPENDYIDLSEYIKGNFKSNIDLLLIIKCLGKDNINLISAIKSLRTSTKNLRAVIQEGLFSYINLPAYLKQGWTAYSEFIKIIRVWAKVNVDLINYIRGPFNLYNDLGSYIRGKDAYTLFDLRKYIKSTETNTDNLLKIIKGFERNIIVNLIGYTKINTVSEPINLPGYTKSTKILYRDVLSYLQAIPPLDLTLTIEPIPPVDLSAYLRMNDRIKVLLVYIRAFQEVDIGVFIRSMHFFDLLSYLKCIPSVNITASIYGWAQLDLSFRILPRLTPELKASIFPIPPKDLKSIIHVFRGMGTEFNLKNTIAGVLLFDLPASLFSILPVNLNMSITPSGQVYDLNLRIKPKVIFMKAIIYVSLLEHTDLNMAINNGCVFSKYCDLPIQFYPLYLKELFCSIRPRLAINQLKNLNCVINYREHVGINVIDVDFFTGRKSDVYTLIDIEYEPIHTLMVENKIDLIFSKAFSKNLYAVLKCIPASFNLPINIVPIDISAYKFNPEWVNLSTKRIVINKDRLYEQWRRIVELYFDTGIKDNYDLNKSHVFAAMIRKFSEAKQNGTDVILWGDGTPYREFLHVDDLTNAMLFLILNYNGDIPLNIGTGKDITIKDLAERIAKAYNFKGRIIWDTSKPNGTPKKLLDVSKIKKLGWESKISLNDGIAMTIKIYKSEII